MERIVTILMVCGYVLFFSAIKNLPLILKIIIIYFGIFVVVKRVNNNKLLEQFIIIIDFSKIASLKQASLLK